MTTGVSTQVLRTAFVLLVLGALNGCKHTATSTQAPGAHSTHYHNVAIQNLAFVPTTVAFTVNDTVVWTNDDTVEHTVTSDTGNELAGDLMPGTSYQHIFATPGSFPYHCSIHPDMHGRVTVE